MIKKRIVIQETNILLTSDIEPSYVVGFITRQREELKRFIRMNREFKTSLEPLKVVSAPEIVKMMASSAQIAGVGPMAAVAGTIAQLVAEKFQNQ